MWQQCLIGADFRILQYAASSIVKFGCEAETRLITKFNPEESVWQI